MYTSATPNWSRRLLPPLRAGFGQGHDRCGRVALETLDMIEPDGSGSNHGDINGFFSSHGMKGGYWSAIPGRKHEPG